MGAVVAEAVGAVPVADDGVGGGSAAGEEEGTGFVAEKGCEAGEEVGEGEEAAADFEEAGGGEHGGAKSQAWERS